MCQAKPGVRCASHTYTDLLKAEASLSKAQQQQQDIETFIASVDTSQMDTGTSEQWEAKVKGLRSKATATVSAKQKIYEKRDKQFSVACLSAEKNSRAVLSAQQSGQVSVSDEEQAKHHRIVERVDAVRSGGYTEVVQREAVLLGYCHKYEQERRKYPDLPLTKTVLGKSGNPRLIADTLNRLNSLPKDEGGRTLTEDEQSWLDSVKMYPGRDYLETPTPRASLPLPKPPVIPGVVPDLVLKGNQSRSVVDADRFKGVIKNPEQLLRSRPPRE